MFQYLITITYVNIYPAHATGSDETISFLRNGSDEKSVLSSAISLFGSLTNAREANGKLVLRVKSATASLVVSEPNE